MTRQELLDRGWHPIQVNLLLGTTDAISERLVRRAETSKDWEPFRHRAAMLIHLQQFTN